MTIRDQPPPRPSGGPAIADLVVADIQERKRVGIERYGTPLQAGNGRDALVDAYQEDLDRIQYTRQAIEERRAERRATRALVEALPLQPMRAAFDSAEEYTRWVDALSAVIDLMKTWPKEET